MSETVRDVSTWEEFKTAIVEEGVEVINILADLDCNDAPLTNELYSNSSLNTINGNNHIINALTHEIDTSLNCLISFKVSSASDKKTKIDINDLKFYNMYSSKVIYSIFRRQSINSGNVNFNNCSFQGYFNGNCNFTDISANFKNCSFYLTFASNKMETGYFPSSSFYNCWICLNIIAIGNIARDSSYSNMPIFGSGSVLESCYLTGSYIDDFSYYYSSKTLFLTLVSKINNSCINFKINYTKQPNSLLIRLYLCGDGYQPNTINIYNSDKIILNEVLKYTNQELMIPVTDEEMRNADVLAEKGFMIAR